MSCIEASGMVQSLWSFLKPSSTVTVGGTVGDARWRWLMVAMEVWVISTRSRSTTETSLIWGFLMEDSSQSSSMHVYVFLHRELGVTPGRSDQLGLAESGLLTLDPCRVVLPINPSGLSWSWCSVLSSGSAKHTGTFTLQLPLSVSFCVSLLLFLTSGRFDLLVNHDHVEAQVLIFHFSLTCTLFKIAKFHHFILFLQEFGIYVLLWLFTEAVLLFANAFWWSYLKYNMDQMLDFQSLTN